MIMGQKVDLHIHSLYSDGRCRIPEIMQIIKKEAITVFAITDHDTVDGIQDARDAAGSSAKCIAGIEFTCREQRFSASGNAFSIHLLGYGFDPENIKLRARLDKRKHEVTEVYDRLCKEITQMGYKIRREDVPISCGIVMQLCDVEAYVRQLYPLAPEEVYGRIEEYASDLDQVNISVREAMDLIHDALPKMKETGLDGLEADYLDFTEEERGWLRDIASRNGLITTAGSDFHGSPGRSRMGVDIKGDQL